MEKQQMKIGIFGGTFDPIHNGHVRAASEFLKQAALDRLYIIPDRIPPHKSIGKGDDPAVRLAMTRLAFSESPEWKGRAIVSDMEIKSEGKSYSYLTLKRFADMGFSDLYLYCGTDMLLTFDEWFRFEDILSMCTLAYAAREHQTDNLALQVAEKKKLLINRYGAKILDISLDPTEISSSEIRQMIGTGRDVSPYLPPSVYEYIKEKNLYR